MDLFTQYPQQDLMIKRVETPGDITLDEPIRSLPDIGDLLQRGVTATPGTKSMAVVGELNVVVRVKQHAHHFGQ